LQDKQRIHIEMDRKKTVNEVTHRYYWELTGRHKDKPVHPGEEDEFIPEQIRGIHFDSWTEIAEALGYKKDVEE